MRIYINGEALDVKDSALMSLLQNRAPDTTFAVAINGEFVPRSRYALIELKAGDEIDILSPMQGG